MNMTKVIDPVKKRALISWVNIICEDQDFSVQSLLDLKDGLCMEWMIKLIDVNPQEEEEEETSLDSLSFVKRYLESVYPNIFDATSLVISFPSIGDPLTSEEALSWEIAKVLLALLAALIQEQKSDRFMQSTNRLTCDDQLQIMECFQSLLTRDVNVPLEEDFADVLTKPASTDCRPTEEQQICVSTPINVPAGKTRHLSTCLNGSLFDSPLYGNLSFQEMQTSDSPLGSFLQSPVISQKAVISQQAKELRKLKVKLGNEIHCKEMLELDVQEKCRMIAEKESKIFKLETLLREQRKYKDAVDELQAQQAEVAKLTEELKRTKLKLQEENNLKAENSDLEKSNKNLHREVSRLKKLLKELEDIKKQNDELHTKYCAQKLESFELKSNLNIREAEVNKLRTEVDSLKTSIQHAVQQKDVLKKEKEELEELVSFGGSVSGENMGVVLEIRMKELEDELEQIKSSWIEPSTYQALKKQLENATIMSEALEAKYSEKLQQQNKVEGELEESLCKIKLLEDKQTYYHNELKDKESKLKASVQTISELQNTVLKLQSSEKKKDVDLQELRARMSKLDSELTRSKAECELSMRELESQKIATESRRQTLSGSFEKVMLERNSLIQQLEREKAAAENTIQELVTKLHKQNDHAISVEESLKSTIKDMEASSIKDRSLFEKERLAKENMITRLKEEVRSLKEEVSEKEERFDHHLTAFMQEKDAMKYKFDQERSSLVARLGNVTTECENLRKSTKAKVGEADEAMQKIIQEKQIIQNELEKVKLQAEDQDLAWNEKLDNMRAKYYSEVSRLSKTIEDLKSTNQSLNEKFESETVNLEELESRVSETRESLTLALHENEEKRSEMQRERDQHKDEVASIESKHAEMLQQINEDHGEEIAKMEAKHEAEISAITEGKLRLERKVSELEEEKSALEITNKQLHQRVEKHQKKLESSAKDLEVQQMEYNALVTDLQKLQGVITEFEDNIDIMNSKYDTLEREKCELDELYEDSKKVACEVKQAYEQLQVENAELMEKYKEMKDKNACLSRMIEEGKLEKESAQEKVRRQQTLAAELKEKLDTQRSELQAQKSQLIAELENTRSKLKALKNIESENAKILDKFNSLKGENEHLKKNLEGQIEEVKEKERKESELRDQLTEKKQQILSLKEQKSDFEVKNAQLVKQITDQADRNSDLQRKISELEGVVKESDSKRDDALSEVVALQTENKSLKNQLTSKEEKQTKESDWQEKLKIANEKAAHLTAKNKKMQEELAAKEADLTKANKLLSSYKVYYEEKKQTIAQLKKDLTTKTEENEDLERRVKGLVSQIRSLEVQLDHSTGQIKELQKKIDDTGTIYLGDGAEFKRMKTATDVFEESIADSLDGNGLQCNDLDDSIFAASPAEMKKKGAEENSDSKEPVTPRTKSDLGSNRRRSLDPPSKPVPPPIHPFSRSLGYKDIGMIGSTPVSKKLAPWCHSPFDWSRASELQRRNTLCPPHLKTSYPVETQQADSVDITDSELRESMLINSGVKRKLESYASEDDGNAPLKQARQQSSRSSLYVTPVSTTRPRKRSSSQSPRVPISRTKLKSYSKVMDKENLGVVKKLALNIGGTPKTKQTGALAKTSSKVGKLINLFNKKSESTPSSSRTKSPKKKSVLASTPNSTNSINEKSPLKQIVSDTLSSSVNPKKSTPIRKILGTPNSASRPKSDRPINTPIKPKSHHLRVMKLQNSPKTPTKKTPIKHLTNSFRALRNTTPVKNISGVVKSVTTPIKNRQNKVHPTQLDVK